MRKIIINCLQSAEEKKKIIVLPLTRNKVKVVERIAMSKKKSKVNLLLQ